MRGGTCRSADAQQSTEPHAHPPLLPLPAPPLHTHTHARSRDAPRWVQVRVRLVRRLARQLSLEELKRHSGGALADMALFKYGRLSVQPVTPAQWDFVLGLEGGEGGA